MSCVFLFIGTRIVYERQFLMQLRNSPMARTPPTNILFVPGASPNKKSGLCENNNSTQKSVINSNQKSPERLAPDNARKSRDNSNLYQLNIIYPHLLQ